LEKRNKMLANESIGKLLLKLSLPATIGMIVMSLYNVVDAIFVGRGVGTYGIAAIAISFPIQMIIMAISMTMGIGGASIISRSLGAKDKEKAELTYGNIITSAIILSIIITILCTIFITPILKLFGATPTLLPYSIQYLQVIIYGTVFTLLAMSQNNVVRSEGNANVAMYTMIISAVLNAIMDYFFIFWFRWGLTGAALATVISQAITVMWLFGYFFSGKSSIRLHRKNLIPNSKIIKEMFAIGASSFARQVTGSIMVAILNVTLAIYGGDIIIAAFGIISRVTMFTLMPMFGIIQGMQPILGFNYGAKNLSRVKEVLRLSIISSTSISIIGFVIFISMPTGIIKIFTNDPQLIGIASDALRIIILATPLIGFQVVGASLFQAIGRARPAFFLSICRQLLFLIPLVIILPKFLHLTGIWISFPIADTLAFIVTYVMYKREINILSAPA